ncbi:sensory box protein [Janthinobacterium agaricidamnosum NBRC 102515 = DSM 9628]|uniref:histidine kinase n=1 Tax=Janthinobacterium agaricidamnosum NBRC 102515 = DSM 9628 TaxID=1349767 RepID=W0V750_9BURK|nr:sensory box protein [Janthinobacterium agaricidamnosum NBRC 102515 = DSM 9628]
MNTVAFVSWETACTWYIPASLTWHNDIVHANKIIALLDAEHAAIAGIASGATLATGLERLAAAIEAQADDAMQACFLLLDEADRFTELIGCGLPAAFSALLPGSEAGPRTHPFGAAAFSGAPVFCSDIGQDLSWTVGRKDALVHGLRACWAAPVFSARGRILGVLGMLFHAARHPTQPETELMHVAARAGAHVIERYLSEKSLGDSEDHFRHAFELNAQVLWTADIDGQLDYVARRWREWTGNSGLGGSWSEAIHPADLVRTQQAWRHAVASGDPCDVEHRVRMQDGRYRWVRSRAMCRRNERGHIVKWYGSTEDINEYWVARANLLKSEDEFRSLAEAMPNQAWLARKDGLIYWFNERVHEYSGTVAGVAQEGDWNRIMHPDDFPGALAAWRQAVASGQGYEIEFRLRRASDHSYRWFLARAVPVYDESGAVVRWVGTNTDVQEQKNVFEKLAYLNSSLEIEMANRTADRDRMWRLSTDIMLVADFSGSIMAVNPAWSALLGRAEGESLGMDFVRLVHPEDRASTWSEISKLERGAAKLRFENRYLHSAGSYRWISWTAVAAQELIHAIGRDVTDEKEARLALLRSEQALLQAQKLESIGKLTGGVAHDFNNVLQIISGNLQLLELAVQDNPLALKRMESSAAAVERGAKLSSQLLAFARRQPLKPLVTNLGFLLRSMEELVRRAIGDGIEAEIMVSDDLWHTLVDPSQMENVLLNMALNARDAMNGSGKLSFALSNVVLDDVYAANHADAQAGQYVLLSISDTGHGIERDIIDQIFEPFFSTKKEGEGTGLGLSMAYGFIHQSGGHIKVYSTAGQGSTFKVYLPRSLEALSVLPASLSGPLQGGTETILVVEDDAQVQSTVVDMLRGLGYRVLKAYDGLSALTILQSGVPVDLLFTDVVMPGELRSPELARQAKALLPRLEVLFTSGYTHNAIMHDGRLDPGVELLSKPYLREDLARKVHHLLSSRQPAGVRVEVAADAPSLHGRRILLVEDNPDARELTTELLQLLGHTVHGVCSAEEALGMLDIAGLDVLITDISLPHMSGIELARQVRLSRPQLDIVFSTGYDRRNILVKDEAARFLPKPFSLEELEAVLRV